MSTQTSEYISTIILDNNKKHLINEVLEFLIGVGTFTITSSFDTQSLRFVTMNELEKFMPGGLELFPFYLVVPCSACFQLEFEATSHNAMFAGRCGTCIIRSGVVFFC